MTGKDVIDYIKANGLEDAKVTVTATMYYQGDHDCRTTDDVSISEGSEYLGKGKYMKTVDFYIDCNLY
jgi:hypothetical protein